jgi:hypothetical protein
MRFFCFFPIRQLPSVYIYFIFHQQPSMRTKSLLTYCFFQQAI